MILTELSSIQSGDLPFYEFKNHLRLGTGFSDDTLQDPLLEAYLRAAISAIESKIGQALLSRSFKWQVMAWQSDERQGLPMRPISQILSVEISDDAGASEALSPDSYRLIHDLYGGAIAPIANSFPTLKQNSSIEIDFIAGFGPNWADIPADLAQAVLLLSAHFYENRSASQSQAMMPMAVLSLIEAYRPIRLGASK